MGMFDTIKCEYPLPGNPPSGIEFQTKDLDCSLTTYTITKEGRLVCDEWHYEATPKEKLRYPDATDWRRCIGSLTRVVDRAAVDQEYHGILNFYGDINTGELRAINLQTGEDSLHPGPDPEYFEYEAVFTHGRLESVKRLAPAN